MREPAYFLSRIRPRLALIARTSSDLPARRRAKIALALDRGTTYREIERTFACSAALVSRVAAAINRADTGFFLSRRKKRRRTRLRRDIAEALRRIVNERMRSGEPFTTRGLARELGVPVTTVRRYRERLILPGHSIEVVTRRALDGNDRVELFERSFKVPLPLGVYVDHRRSAIAFQHASPESIRRRLEPELAIPDASLDDVLSEAAFDQLPSLDPDPLAKAGMGPLAAFISVAAKRRGPFSRLFVLVTNLTPNQRRELKRLLRYLRDGRVYVASNHAVWLQAAAHVATGFDAAPPDVLSRLGLGELHARRWSRQSARPFVWFRGPITWTDGRPHPMLTGDFL